MRRFNLALAIACVFAAEGSFDFAAMSARTFAPPSPVSNAVDATSFKRRFELPHSTGGVWRLTFDYLLDHSSGSRICGARTHVALGPKVMPWGKDVRGIDIPDSGVSKDVLYPWRHDVEIMPGTAYADVSFDLFGKGDFRVSGVRFEEVPPDEELVTLELPFGGYFDGEFHIGAGQAGFPVVVWRTRLRDEKAYPSSRFTCKVSATDGFTVVDVSKGAPGRSRLFGSLLGIAVRADCDAGATGCLTVVAEVDGKAASKPLKLKLVSVPPVKAAKRPSRYANGAYRCGGMNFRGCGMRALAKTLHDAGATWLIPQAEALSNDPSILPMLRDVGFTKVTPDGSGIIANGFASGRKEFCPCALYGDDSPARIALRQRLAAALKGCDGMWSNWEPYAYAGGRRPLCERCRAAEKGLEADALQRLRTSEHARVVAAVAAEVSDATDGKAGFIPGIYWPELGPGHDGFEFTREIRVLDYARGLSHLNAFGPYVRWNTELRYVPEPGRAVAYFVVAREVMRQVEDDYAPEERPQLMAFPLGLSGMSWASQPEWLELALESFYFNGWVCATPWSFPAGGDARFLAAFARASECAAEWEDFVWDGARADGAVSVKPRGTVRSRPWIDRTYLPAARDVSLIQYASYEKGGERIVAVFNFDESASVVCDVSLRRRTRTLSLPPSSCRVVRFK